MEIWEISVPSNVILYGEMRKDLCPYLIKLYLDNINRENRDNGRQKLIPVLECSHRKDRSSPPAMALTLKARFQLCNLGLSCKSVFLGRGEWEGEKHARIHLQ